MEDLYNVAAVIDEARRSGYDISPADRLEWKMFCCALKVLGYDESTFVALSSCNEADARKAWRAESRHQRYATMESAKAKIIALAKNAGMDLSKFKLSQEDKGESRQRRGVKAPERPKEAPQRKNTPQPDCYIIPAEIVEQKAAEVEKTALYVWLCKEVGKEEATAALQRYRVGAANFISPEGYKAAALPYINPRGECIDLKLMHFSPESGSRKNYLLYTYSSKGERREVAQSWAVAEMNKNICFDCRRSTPRRQCPGKDVCPMRKHRAPWPYFGEHLLSNLPRGSAVAVVESEKTALFLSVIYPEFVWIATGSKDNLTPERCTPLKPFAVTLFPDRDAVKEWEKEAQELANLGYNIKTGSPTIQAHAEGDKDDLADIILNFLHNGGTTAADPPRPSADEVGATKDRQGNFIPWRRAVPEPDRESDPEAWFQWMTDRAAWLYELREQCTRCEHAQLLGGKFKGCRLHIPDEEAASEKRCRGYVENPPVTLPKAELKTLQ